MNKKQLFAVLFFSKILHPSIHTIMTEKERFDYALQDAQVVSFSKINKKLIEITPWNKSIKQSKKQNSEKITVASLMEISTAIRFFTSATISNQLNLLLKNQTHQLQPSSNGFFNLSNVTKNKIKFFLNLKDLEYLKKNLAEPTHLTGSLKAFPIVIQEAWRPSWVTIVPEVQSFINKEKNKLLVQSHLDERLGLPHNSQTIKVIVEMNVAAKNIIRPSIDANPLTQESYGDFFDFENKKKLLYNMHIPLFDPYSNLNATGTQRDILAKEKLNSYFDWIQKQTTDAYAGQWAMPWTQLGYSYDYSQEAFDNNNHFGFSEFIIKPGSNVTITGIYSLDAYSFQYESTISNIYEKLYNKINALLQKTQPLLQKKSNANQLLKLYSDANYFILQLEAIVDENPLLVSKKIELQALQSQLVAAGEEIKKLFMQKATPKKALLS